MKKLTNEEIQLRIDRLESIKQERQVESMLLDKLRSIEMKELTYFIDELNKYFSNFKLNINAFDDKNKNYLNKMINKYDFNNCILVCSSEINKYYEKNNISRKMPNGQYNWIRSSFILLSELTRNPKALEVKYIIGVLYNKFGYKNNTQVKKMLTDLCLGGCDIDKLKKILINGNHTYESFYDILQYSCYYDLPSSFGYPEPNYLTDENF